MIPHAAHTIGLTIFIRLTREEPRVPTIICPLHTADDLGFPAANAISTTWRKRMTGSIVVVIAIDAVSAANPPVAAFIRRTIVCQAVAPSSLTDSSIYVMHCTNSRRQTTPASHISGIPPPIPVGIRERHTSNPMRSTPRSRSRMIPRIILPRHITPGRKTRKIRFGAIGNLGGRTRRRRLIFVVGSSGIGGFLPMGNGQLRNGR
mmetsp:Transcript_12510/g.26406  ORF Transcript_12510/g.26406 Transcript_12510/m.26406 type:complete len:205 (-) Transcript_12510:1737-2351(-)